MVYDVWLSLFPNWGGEVVMCLLSSFESFDFSDPFCILGLAAGNAEMTPGIRGQTLPWT